MDRASGVGSPSSACLRDWCCVRPAAAMRQTLMRAVAAMRAPGSSSLLSMVLSLCMLLWAASPVLAIDGQCAPPVSYTSVQLNSEGVWLSPPANFSTRGCVIRIDAALQPQPVGPGSTSGLYLQVSMRTLDGWLVASVQQSISASAVAPINATVVACPDPEQSPAALGAPVALFSFIATGTPGAFFSFVASAPSAQLTVPYSSPVVERVDPSYVRAMFFVLTEEMIEAAQSVEVKVETARPTGDAMHDCELAMLYVGSTLRRPPPSPFNSAPAHNFQSCPDTTTIQYDNKFASRLTFFDHGAIVLSSGSRPPLKAGSTIFVGVTSLGRTYGGDFCEFPPTPEDMAAGQQSQLSHVKEYRISVTVIPKRATVQFAIAISFLCLALFLTGWIFAACPCLFPWPCYGRRQVTPEQREANLREWRRQLRPYWHQDDLETEVEVGWTGFGSECLKRAFSMWFHTGRTGRKVGSNTTAAAGATPHRGPVADPVLERPYSYSWFFLTTISAFFITAIQFVITNWTLMRETGNRDLCFYNELCFRPMASPTNLPWNNLLSNLPYVAAGLSFILFVSLHESRFQRPRQSTLFYAMGWALVGEGLCSLGYHICPRPSVFQMDTACMYAIAMLGMLNLYQHGEQRHRSRPIFRAARVFLFLYVPLLAINYLGVWQSDAARAVAVVLLMILFAAWGSLVLARFGRASDKVGHVAPAWAFIIMTIFFAIILPILALPGIAAIAVADAILYALIGQLIITFFIVSLLRAGEKDVDGQVVWVTPRRVVWWLLLLSFLGMFCAAAYFFTREGGSTNKNLSEAAASRNLNRPCLNGVGNSLDAHDIWHILGAYALFAFFCVIYYSNPPRPAYKPKTTAGAGAADAKGPTDAPAAAHADIPLHPMHVTFHVTDGSGADVAASAAPAAAGSASAAAAATASSSSSSAALAAPAPASSSSDLSSPLIPPPTPQEPADAAEAPAPSRVVDPTAPADVRLTQRLSIALDDIAAAVGGADDASALE